MAAKKSIHAPDAAGPEELAGDLDSFPGTELKRAQLYLNMAGVMIVALDINGRVSMINRRGCEILGGKLETILGRNWFDHFIPESRRGQVRDLFLRILHQKHKGDESSEGPVLTLENEQRLIAWHNAVIRDDAGTVIGTLSSGEDVTDFRRAEEELRESRGLYQAFINANCDMIFVKDDQFRYVIANKALKDFFQRPYDELIHRTDFELMEISAAERCRESDQRALESDSVVITEETVGQRIFETTKFPLRLKGGRRGIGGIIRDVTQQRHAEDEREHLREQMSLAQKMESVGRLAGGVAHDFNHTLNIIMEHAQTAIEKLAPAEPLHAELGEIRRAARRSADLTRQLLAFAEQQTATPRVIDLNDTIGGMIRMLDFLIGEDIELIWEPGETIWKVYMDPAQVDQILTNLCVNARDAISGKGRITIETRNLTVDDRQLNLQAGFIPGEYIRLSISDNGCGMDRKTMANAFEPFFTTKEKQASGLGLSSVYGIVKQNGGFIHAYSEPGRGSTFHVCLPRYLENRTITDPGDVPLPNVERHETILLVEDEAAVLKLGQRMLQELGYQVLTANNPQQAKKVSHAFSKDIDLLIVDMVLPGMNGCELAAALKRSRPQMKILLMSGYTMDMVASQCKPAQKLRFIQKPFTICELDAGVRQALQEEMPES